MKKTILYVFLLLTLSCGNSDYASEISRLEKLHLDQPTAEIKKQLVAAYKGFIETNTDDKTKSSTYSSQQAKLEMDLNQYQNAASTLTNAIKNYPENGSTTNNIQMISSLLLDRVHPNNPQEAITAFSGLFSDQNSMKTQVNNIINNLKNTMLNTSTTKWDRTKVNDYISLSRLYAGIMPKDANSSEYLYKAAEIANALGKHPKAILIYDSMLADAASYPDVAKTLFLKGYTLDEHYKKYDEAKAIYEKVTTDYPDSKFAESAKASISFLGKSPEEILKSFEEGKK